MSLKVNPKKAMYVICMLFILNMNYSLFHTSYVYQIGSLLSILSIIWIMAKGKIDRMLMDGIVGFVMPMICITLISVTTAIVIYHTGNRGDITQSVWRCILYVKGFILAYVSVKLFGKDCVRLITYAGLISYFTVIIRWIFTAGVPEMFHIFNNMINGVSLEIHNVTYCFGLLFIYYFLTDQETKKIKNRMCVLLGIAIFLGNKRALYLALGVTLFIYWLMHRFQSKQMLILKICLICYVVVAFGYIWMIDTGLFGLLLQVLGIADNSRLTFWNFFSKYYEVSPTYWGRGVAFTDNLMAARETMRSMQITTQTQMHNDILRVYIGWGFWPFLLYFVNFFVLRLRYMIKKGKQVNTWRYFAIASCTFFIYFLDNMIDGTEFNLCFFVIWFLLVGGKCNEK